MSIVERARALRATIEGLATTLSDEVAADNAELFPNWNGNGVEYVTGDRVRYQGILYKVLMDHTSQETWNPADSPSLFARILIPDPEVIPVWIQPESTNGYSAQDKVYYPNEGDTIYISLVDNNVWVPTTVGVWAVYEDESGEDEPTPDPTPDPTPTPDPDPEPEPTPTPDPTPEPDPDEDEDEIPEWVTPSSTVFYNTGDKVHYTTINDPVYECLIDNCVWSPVDLPSAWRLVDEE